MSRDSAIKVVLKLIGLILAQHGWVIRSHDGIWQLNGHGHQSDYPDQLSAVLAGCEKVISGQASSTKSTPYQELHHPL